MDSEQGIVFDVSRSADIRSFAEMENAWVMYKSYPKYAVMHNNRDEANDDRDTNDEDNRAFEDRLFVVDMPGFFNPNPAVPSYEWYMNALEFVRVRLDGKRFDHATPVVRETVQGSRSSDFIPWNTRIKLISQNGVIHAPVGADNKIALGDNPIPPNLHR
jgi:hypothetical protein